MPLITVPRRLRSSSGPGAGHWSWRPTTSGSMPSLPAPPKAEHWRAPACPPRKSAISRMLRQHAFRWAVAGNPRKWPSGSCGSRTRGPPGSPAKCSRSTADSNSPDRGAVVAHTRLVGTDRFRCLRVPSDAEVLFCPGSFSDGLGCRGMVGAVVRPRDGGTLLSGPVSPPGHALTGQQPCLPRRPGAPYQRPARSPGLGSRGTGSHSLGAVTARPAAAAAEASPCSASRRGRRPPVRSARPP